MKVMLNVAVCDNSDIFCVDADCESGLLHCYAGIFLLLGLLPVAILIMGIQMPIHGAAGIFA